MYTFLIISIIWLLTSLVIAYLLIIKPVKNEKALKKEEQNRQARRVSDEIKSSFSGSINQGFDLN